VGGVPELVTDGVDGFLEPVGDIAAQAGRVTQLLTNEDLYRSMATAARQTAVERFASSIIIPKYEQYYREIVEGGAHAKA
jgi:glycosyltransferase involved in cell wall biosynthesis